MCRFFRRTTRARFWRELTEEHRFTLYEYFITDKIGHAQDFEKAREYLPPLAEFFRETLRLTDLETTTVILTSDHGNIEDLSVRTNHTLNDVPTIVWGRKRYEIAERYQRFERHHAGDYQFAERIKIFMEFQKNDRREIFGWLMYDWANSAFYTTVIGVLLGPYLTSLAQTPSATTARLSVSARSVR